MSYHEDMQELAAIMEVLEVPAVWGWQFELSVFRPDPCPETLAEILEYEKAAERPHIILREPVQSYNRNMFNMVASAICDAPFTDTTTFGDDHINLKDEGGTLRGTAANQRSSQMVSGGLRTAVYGDTTTKGIRVGTGSTAESFEDYVLGTQISHGDAGGELRYFEMQANNYSWSGGTRQWTTEFRRYFTNHSGGSIVVAELGLVAELFHATLGTSYFMVLRDVPASTVTIAHHELLRAQYVFTTPVWPS